jgi:membrane protein DedA with SNARE-associated domain
MLTEWISDIATKILESTGYAGATALMALESMVFPIPSEAVMPFVGFLVADNRWQLGAAIAATSLGSLVGSLLSYAMGYFGGKPLVLSLGKYLLLNVNDLTSAERFFNRQSGAWSVFVARFVPIVRHLISIPAGVGRMPLATFVLVTVLGSTLWNCVLLYCGIRLREHWTLVHQYGHQIDVAMGIVLLVLVSIYIKRRI